MSTATAPVAASRDLGYQSFSIGAFSFRRDEYFAYINYPTGQHIMSIDAFLRALMRDVAWGFFYGTVNFDDVIGTTNHYGTVDLYAGAKNAAFVAAKKDYMETFNSKDLRAGFVAILADRSLCSTRRDGQRDWPQEWQQYRSTGASTRRGQAHGGIAR